MKRMVLLLVSLMFIVDALLIAQAKDKGETSQPTSQKKFTFE